MERSLENSRKCHVGPGPDPYPSFMPLRCVPCWLRLRSYHDGLIFGSQIRFKDGMRIRPLFRGVDGLDGWDVLTQPSTVAVGCCFRLPEPEYKHLTSPPPGSSFFPISILINLHSIHHIVLVSITQTPTSSI
ncbi:hypothetical protein FALCPG4_002579 [Fusarium falciforme]